MIVAREMRESDFTLTLRDADARECAIGGLSSYEALASGATSTFSYTVEANGEPVAFWGYSSETLISSWCYTWLLTRPQIEPYKHQFARISKRLISHIHETYSEIWCFADEEYTLAKRWLLWLGFLPSGYTDQGLLKMRKVL